MHRWRVQNVALRVHLLMDVAGLKCLHLEGKQVGRQMLLVPNSACC